MLGFLWCQGTDAEKGDFLFNLIKEDVPYRPKKEKPKARESSWMSPSKVGAGGGDEMVLIWMNPNLKYVFLKIMELAIDMPTEFAEKFSSEAICNE